MSNKDLKYRKKEDYNFLEKLLDQSSYKKGNIAKLMGLSMKGYHSVIRNPSKCNLKEIYFFAKLLKVDFNELLPQFLSEDDKIEIDQNLLNFK